MPGKIRSDACLGRYRSATVIGVGRISCLHPTGSSNQECQTRRSQSTGATINVGWIRRRISCKSTKEATNSSTRRQKYPTASSENTCRICYNGASEDKLLSLCKCSGSVAYTHASCLTRWLRQSKSVSCELCGTAYPLRVTKQVHFLHYLRYLMRKRFICLIFDSVYSLTLFFPCLAFSILQSDIKSGVESTAALVCTLFLLLLTFATWFVTVFWSHNLTYLAWKSRYMCVVLV